LQSFTISAKKLTGWFASDPDIVQATETIEGIPEITFVTVDIQIADVDLGTLTTITHFRGMFVTGALKTRDWKKAA
jgi:hypothetical protein